MEAFRNMHKKLLGMGFLHIFGSSVINQIVSFAYGILIVRVISKTDYGVFIYANNIYSMLILFSGFGIASALLQVGSESADDSVLLKGLFAYSYRFSLTFNSVLCLIILLIGVLVPFPIPGSNNLLSMMTFLPMLVAIKDIQFVWLRVKLKNKLYGYSNSINAILTSSATIMGAWFYAGRGIIIGQYSVVVIMILLLGFLMRVPISFRGEKIPAKHKGDLLRIAGISSLNNTLSQLLSLLGAFMLGLVVKDEGAIASYKVATTIPFALNFIPSSLMTFVYPYFARYRFNKSWVKKNFELILKIMAIANLLITIVGVVMAVPIIQLIFGIQYLDAVAPFRILMCSYFVSGTFRTVSGNLLVTQRKLKANLVSGIIGSVTTITGNFLLIPRHGSNGAAYSHLLSMLFTGVFATTMMITVIRKIQPNSHNDIGS